MPTPLHRQWELHEPALEELTSRLRALSQEAGDLDRGEHIKRNGSPS